MKLREFIFMCLSILSCIVAVRATLFPKPCPILSDLNPEVRSYIDRRMPTDAFPSTESFAKLRERLAVLEDRLGKVQKLTGDTEMLEARQKKVDALLKDLRDLSQKSLAERRTTELQWMKANMASKCLGLSLNSATGKAISPPPLPEDLFKPTPVKPAAVPVPAAPPAPAPPTPAAPSVKPNVPK